MAKACKRWCIVLATPLLIANQCSDSDTKQRDQQERMLTQENNALGMPAIVHYQEKRMLKQILELRDTTIVTITYIADWQGHLHKICDSIGYGIPYATQYTNPQKFDGDRVIAQADPNGLFSPPAAEGTWVNCLDPVTKQGGVVYLEPRVVVSPFPLNVP